MIDTIATSTLHLTPLIGLHDSLLDQAIYRDKTRQVTINSANESHITDPAVMASPESRGSIILLHNSVVNSDLQDDTNTTMAINILLVT